MSEYVNVADFGADPTGETYSTVAIQTAIDVASKRQAEQMAEWKREHCKPWTATFWRWVWFAEGPPACPVYFEPGTFKIGSVTARESVQLIGAAAGSTTVTRTRRKRFWADSRLNRRLGYWWWRVTNLRTREDDDWDDDEDAQPT